MRKTLSAFPALALLTICFFTPLLAQNKPEQVPKEVREIVGTYTGSWTSYNLDRNGQVIKQATWTDTLKAENPVVEKSRAYVTTTDDLVFEGGKIPPIKVPGKEGYLLNSDGGLGEYFIEVFGQTYKMRKLDENTWAYTAPAAPQEFALLGAANVLSGQHALLKVVTFEGGIETHHISRLTTVRWKEASGKERSTQFVSLQGQHQRQRN